MAFVVKDRVKELSTALGTSNLGLSGNLNGFFTFSSSMNVGDEFYYSVVNRSGNEAEVGYGSLALNGATYELVRTSVIRSTNGNGLVNFTNGNKEVSLAYTAAQFAQIETQVSVVTSLAEAMTSLAAVTSVAAEHATSSALVASSAALVATSAEGVAVSSALFAAAQASLAAAYTSAVLASGAAAASTPFFLVSSPSTVAFNKSRVLNFVSSNFDSTDNGGGGTYDVSLKPTLLDPVLLSASAKTRFIVETTADVSVGNFVRIAATSVAVSVLTPTSVTGGSYASITLTGTTTLPGAGQISSGGNLTITGTAYLGGAAGAESLRVVSVASAVSYWLFSGNTTGNNLYMQASGSDSSIGMHWFTKGDGPHRFYSRGTGGSGYKQFAINSSGTNAVNNFAVQGGAAGVGAYLYTEGSDTNIEAYYSTKGSSPHRFFTGGITTAEQFRIAHTASAVNYLEVAGGATSGAAYIWTKGSDTSINFDHGTKGSGSHRFFTNADGNNRQFAITHTASATRYITVTGSNGGNPAISVSGGELAVGTNAWTFGVANVVSPTSPNRTLTITIGGTTYYIAAKTTND